jgi:hypothetical protein
VLAMILVTTFDIAEQSSREIILFAWLKQAVEGAFQNPDGTMFNDIIDPDIV